MVLIGHSAPKSVLDSWVPGWILASQAFSFPACKRGTITILKGCQPVKLAFVNVWHPEHVCKYSSSFSFRNKQKTHTTLALLGTYEFLQPFLFITFHLLNVEHEAKYLNYYWIKVWDIFFFTVLASNQICDCTDWLAGEGLFWDCVTIGALGHVSWRIQTIACPHLPQNHMEGAIVECWVGGDSLYWKPGICILWPFFMNGAPWEM